MKLLICVLNWRTADMTARAVSRVLDEARKIPAARVCVVDNDSQDGSAEALKLGRRKPV